MMIKILIVDDNNDKLVKIVEAIRKAHSTIIIDTAIDIINAKRQLNKYIYDLLILDIQLPNKNGDNVIEDGGVKLLKELSLTRNLIMPKYIIGLSAYSDVNFSKIWPLIKYDTTSTSWLSYIEEIIFHISKVIEYKPFQNKIIETIFLEGNSDLKIFNESLRLFRPDLLDNVLFKAIKGGGSKWVARQIISWAHSLQRKVKGGDYVKSIGLLDKDESGNDSRKEINRVIKSDSAQSTTFKVFTLDYKYAKHLLPLVQKGILIPVALEELFELDYWKYAQSKNWLELRTNNFDYLEDPKDWDKYKMSLEEYMKSKGLSENELLYTYKFKDEHKDDFVDYILGLKEEERKTALSNFKILIDDFEKYLFG